MNGWIIAVAVWLAFNALVIIGLVAHATLQDRRARRLPRSQPDRGVGAGYGS